MLRPSALPRNTEDSIGQPIRNYDLVMNCVVHESWTVYVGESTARDHSFRARLSIANLAQMPPHAVVYTIRDKNLVRLES